MLGILAIISFTVTLHPAPQLRANKRDLDEVRSVTRLLEACPSFSYFSVHCHDGKKMKAFLPLLESSMRRLALVPTPALYDALRFLSTAANFISSDENRVLRKWLRAENKSLTKLNEKELGSKAMDTAVHLCKKIFFIDRFLFDAPQHESFAGKPWVADFSAWNAISNGEIDRLYPFMYTRRRGFFLRDSFSLLSSGSSQGYPPLFEFQEYARRYKRRSVF